MLDSLHRRVSQVSMADMISWFFLESTEARQPLKSEMTRTKLPKPRHDGGVHSQESAGVHSSGFLEEGSLSLQITDEEIQQKGKHPFQSATSQSPSLEKAVKY